ncbi:MAG: transcriptional regulator [Marinilabiliales bacterium]|nr:MAG: transcriptional regulator [Marinilabiliales bacterium]
MKYILGLLFIFLLYGQSTAMPEIDSLLLALENTMEHRAEYDEEKNNRIEGLKVLLQKNGISSHQQFFINNQLIEEYFTYTFDSALFYTKLNVQIAKKLNDKELISHSNIIMADILASAGNYLEAYDILKEVEEQTLNKVLKIEYFNALIKVFNEISFHTAIDENFHLYYNTVNIYIDSLMPYLKHDSQDYLSLLEKRYRDAGNLLDAKKINTKRLSQSSPGCRLYSLITFERSLIYQMEGQREMQMKYLIHSAISDIKSSVKDNASLTDLALILHEQDDVERANKFIRFAYEDASFFNSELRFKVISKIFPVINETYNLKIENQKKRLRTLVYIISILLVLLLAALFFIHRQVKTLRDKKNELYEVNQQLKKLNSDLTASNAKLNQKNEELSESNHVKEHYIANFLTICSNYINKLDQTNKRVYKKIANREIQELFNETKTQMTDDIEIKEFYHNFDDTFLHIFPNFVQELNDMLVPEEQIQLKSEERLNTELRIFALIRLGIKDSSKIAQLLRYSVNTIYNYRVKVKNSAKEDRDTFEDRVMKIHVSKD